jgi:uncharacterized protein
MTKILTTLLLLLTLQGFSQKQFNALLISKTGGWMHGSINEGVDALRLMAVNHFFNLEWPEDPNYISEERLKNFDVVIFLNTTGDILNDKQQAAMEKFIQSGKGFVGIHSASDTEYDWPWYTQLVGRMFHIHPTIQTAKLKVVDRKFPGLDRLPDELWWTDEWYEFGEEKVSGLNYILTVDETTFNAKVQWGQKVGNGMGDFHPIAWYHNFDGGRSFYTALGHLPSKFSDQAFLDHLYGGIYWAATGKGMK